MPFPRGRSPKSEAQYQSRAVPTGGAGAVPPHLRVLALCTVLAFGIGMLPGVLGGLFGTVRWLVLGILLVAMGMQLARSSRAGLLWRLRNKLVLTYLLIGLTPVVLLLTLVFLCAYVSAGQFAIHLATEHLQEQLSDLALGNAGAARHVAAAWNVTHDTSKFDLPAFREREVDRSEPGIQMAVFRDGRPMPLPDLVGHARTPLAWAGWLASQANEHFRGIVEDESSVLYLACADRVQAADGSAITAVSSVPLNRERLRVVASELGRVDLLPGLESQAARTPSTAELEQARISGGALPPAANLLDLRVRFLSTLPLRQWESGVARGVPLNVESRPSLLYEQLFAAALTRRTADTVRFALLAVCLLFAVLAAFAVYLALRLSRAMTRSVEDLYAATVSIDRGELQHRIAVTKDDQLADLCRSFNRMSWSLGRLIEQQKEKERIESELVIAQEVQANLFPRQSVQMPTLELHGICRPARTVSGDYYDFLPFQSEMAGVDAAVVTGLGIALGDISGKGISAALLMATLHSAVRAYRFASEELLTPGSLRASHGESEECSELFASPGRILSLLNRHLYRSTTPEKYATLFLAHYDAISSRLTYSNAGQLPPFLLRTDGTIERLDRGGTVVGLMDGMVYEEESLPMRSGDILIAYSDGVTEPENDFGDFGEDRLIDTVRQFCREPLEVISAEVMRALDAWIGDGEQPDDITLVLARQV